MDERTRYVHVSEVEIFPSPSNEMHFLGRHESTYNLTTRTTRTAQQLYAGARYNNVMHFFDSTTQVCQVDTTSRLVRLVKSFLRLISSGQYWT